MQTNFSKLFKALSLMNKRLLVLFTVIFIFLSCTHKYKTIGNIERIDPSLDSIISSTANAEIIAESFAWSEGPLWIDSKKMLLFSDIPNNTVYKWTEENGKEVYLKPSGYTGSTPRGGEVGSNALVLSKDGKLILCQHGNRQMAMMDADIDNPKPVYKTIAGTYQSKKFNSPNDAVYRSDGSLFFTDPPYGLEKNMDDPLKEIPFQGVYKVDASGNVKLLTDSISRPNGIAFMPGEKTLLIANSDSTKPVWYEFDIDANDSLINQRIFYDASVDAKKEQGLPDGMKIDKNGNVFATGPGGVWIFNKEGKILGKIKIPVRCSNIALTPDEKTLFITADMYVLKLALKK
jgi:gluconolactonase